jgi:hypothetical protein
VEAPLEGTEFRWSAENAYVAVTCPWGNHFRCYAPGPQFGDMALGISYVEFLIPRDRAASIARFYNHVLAAPAATQTDEEGAAARVKIGRNQALVFRETVESPPPYDGHHMAIYVSNFSRPYTYLKDRGLISEDVRNHQFRFKEIVDPDNDRSVFVLEHEVRSLHHPMFNRLMVNRNPNESARRYRRGRDALIPYN